MLGERGGERQSGEQLRLKTTHDKARTGCGTEYRTPAVTRNTRMYMCIQRLKRKKERREERKRGRKRGRVFGTIPKYAQPLFYSRRRRRRNEFLRPARRFPKAKRIIRDINDTQKSKPEEFFAANGYGDNNVEMISEMQRPSQRSRSHVIATNQNDACRDILRINLLFFCKVQNLLTKL